MQPRDLGIFVHILRYGLAEQESVHRLFHDGKSLNAARCNLRRLTDAGYLAHERDRWPNAPAATTKTFRYWRLLEPGVAEAEKVLAVTPGRYRLASRPLAGDQLQKRYAIYAFCLSNGTARHVYLQSEFEDFWPTLSQKGVPSWPYYVAEQDSTKVLRFIVVDSFATLKTQLHRILKNQTARIKLPGIGELDRTGHFGVTFLTGDKLRAEAVREAIRENSYRHVEVEVVPQMSALKMN